MLTTPENVSFWITIANNSSKSRKNSKQVYVIPVAKVKSIWQGRRSRRWQECMCTPQCIWGKNQCIIFNLLLYMALLKVLCIPQYLRTSHRPWSIPSHTIRTEFWRPWTVMLTDFDSSLNKDLLLIYQKNAKNPILCITPNS